MLDPRSFFPGRNTATPGNAWVNAWTASSKFAVSVATMATRDAFRTLSTFLM
jgi:hypothetical protein